VRIEAIGLLIKEKLAAETVLVEDFSGGCGAKFDLVVVAKDFEGKSLLDRQRAVNDALKDVMAKIHAVTMKTWTPKQYEERKSTVQGNHKTF
jgi:BolA protein